LGASNELLAVTPQLSRQMKGLFPEDFMSRLQTIANGLGDVDRTIPDLLANTINLSVHRRDPYR